MYAACYLDMLQTHHFSAPVAVYEPSQKTLRDLAMLYAKPTDLDDPPLMLQEARRPVNLDMAERFGLQQQ